MLLSEREFERSYLASEGQVLDGLWSRSEPDIVPLDFSFDNRKEIFFWMLRRLMNDGHLKLAKHGNLLTGTIDEQIECFQQAFPETEEKMEDGIWFFDESCPGGAVWVLEDGSLEWT